MSTFLTATIVADRLSPNPTEDSGDEGAVFDLGVGQGDTVTVTAWAFDDDGEHYYNLDVVLPVSDDDATDTALERLAHALGRYAGITYIKFPGRPHLDLA